VSVVAGVVMDWMAMGAPPPTTTLPTGTAMVVCRSFKKYPSPSEAKL